MNEESTDIQYRPTEPAHVFFVDWSGDHVEAFSCIGSLIDAVVDDPQRGALCKRGFRVWHRGKSNRDERWYAIVLEGDPDYLEHAHPLVMTQLERCTRVLWNTCGTLAHVREQIPGLSVLANIGPGGDTFRLAEHNVHPIDDGGIDLCTRRFFGEIHDDLRRSNLPPPDLGDGGP